MDAERNSLRRHVVTAALLCAVACSGHALASGPATAEAVDPSYPAARGHEAPWLEPIERSHPIRRMSSLKSEYRRIRELRRTQIQPEYERRVAEGEDDADAWREATLREVARRDLRDLRARLER